MRTTEEAPLFTPTPLAARVYLLLVIILTNLVLLTTGMTPTSAMIITLLTGAGAAGIACRLTAPAR
jgi:hypothetical protein